MFNFTLPKLPFYGGGNGIVYSAAAAAKSLQSCLTLCDPIDGSPPGSPVPEILQARTLEWVAISFSSAWKGKVKVKSFSRVRLFETPWTAAHQAPPSMGFSRQEYWSGVPSPSPSSGLIVSKANKKSNTWNFWYHLGIRIWILLVELLIVEWFCIHFNVMYRYLSLSLF